MERWGRRFHLLERAPVVHPQELLDVSSSSYPGIKTNQLFQSTLRKDIFLKSCLWDFPNPPDTETFQRPLFQEFIYPVLSDEESFRYIRYDQDVLILLQHFLYLHFIFY